MERIEMTDYMPVTQMVSEKVTIMVGTFLNKECIKVSSHEKRIGKGYLYGGNLLNEKYIKVTRQGKGIGKSYLYSKNL